MALLTGLISIIVGLLAMVDWRRGLLAVILIGVLQDSFRKLTAGAPAFYIVWSMILYLAVVVMAALNQSISPLRMLYFRDHQIKNAWMLFLVLIVFQLFNAFFRWGSIAVPIFGAIFYLGPIVAMLVACGYATNERRLRQFLMTYVVILVPVCLTVFLSPTYQDAWPILRDVGTFTGDELIIYDVGTALKSYSGILRTGEISSWHAATAAIFLSTLSLTAKGQSHRVIAGVLIVLLVGVIVMTGRRKMLMALSIFFLSQWVLIAWFRKGVRKIAIMILLVGTLASFSLQLLEPKSESSLYMQRSTSVFGDAGDRMALAFRLMSSAFYRSDGIGLGAGSAAQGGRYAGIDQSKLVGGSSESGLGMIMVELGVLGILSIIWLMYTLGRNLVSNLRKLENRSETLFIYQASFLSFLFANLITFSVATQIYGDYFVLIVLGVVAGFAVRLNSLCVTGRKVRSQKIQAV